MEAPGPPWYVWVLLYVFHAALWLLFVVKFSLWEGLAALVAAGFATAGVAVFKSAGDLHFHPALSYLLQAWRLPVNVCTDTVRVLRGLYWRCFVPGARVGLLKAVPFNMGHQDPDAAARRALAIIYSTITPNTIVVGLIESQNLMLYHQILPQEAPKPATELGGPR